MTATIRLTRCKTSKGGNCLFFVLERGFQQYFKYILYNVHTVFYTNPTALKRTHLKWGILLLLLKAEVHAVIYFASFFTANLKTKNAPEIHTIGNLLFRHFVPKIGRQWNIRIIETVISLLIMNDSFEDLHNRTLFPYFVADYGRLTV